ncbi:MAG: chorismate synthase, partial [Rikenellaceae bacterium]
DSRGGGHFSGRITTPLVAAGVVCKKVLGDGVSVSARLIEVGGRDVAFAEEVVEAAMRDGDSVGGVIECRVTGLPVGLGSPFFDSVESVISHAVFSVPAVRAIEFGAGFEAARMRGSQHNDNIIDAGGATQTNNAAGVVGGITNGNDIVFRVAITPTPSISCPQMSYNLETQQVEELRIKGRHDCCIALRAPVVIEAATAIALAQFEK